METKLTDLISNLKELSELETEKFKSIAYSKATRILNSITEVEYSTRSNFLSLPGIGEGINNKILEFRNTGKIDKLIELRKSNSPKLDPKLYKIRKGFITKRISFNLATQYLNEVKSILGDSFISEAGSLRRMKPLIGDIDVLVDSKQYSQVVVKLESKYRKLVSGSKKSSFIIDEINQVQLDIISVTESESAFKLLYLTGSQEFNVHLRSTVKKRGWKLNEYGLYDQFGFRYGCISESDIFFVLGIPYVEPKDR